MLWLSRLTARSAFSLSMNLTLQTLDAMCQNTLQCLSQNHANLPQCPLLFETRSLAVTERPHDASCHGMFC